MNAAPRITCSPAPSPPGDAGVGATLLAVRALAHELAGLVDAAGRYTRLAQRALLPAEGEANLAGALRHLDSAARTLDFAVEAMRNAVAAVQPDLAGFPAEDVSTVVEAATHAARAITPQAQDRGVRVLIDIPATACAIRVPGLVNVLLNVMRNAVQAAPAHTGEVRLRAMLQGDTLMLKVTDNGPGPRGTPVAGRSTTGGAGLGLHISAALMREAGGTLHLESGPESGAVATLSIPLRFGDSIEWDLNDWGE